MGKRSSASRRGLCRSRFPRRRSTRARRAAVRTRRRWRGGPPSGLREKRPGPRRVPWASSSSRYRVRDPRGDLGSEEAHVRERLLVGDPGEAAPEAEVVVGRLIVELDQAVSDLLWRAHEVPLPGQILLPYGIGTGLLPVRAPLRITRALVGDSRAYDLACPSGFLVHEGHPRCDVRERLVAPTVALQGRPDLSVRLRERAPSGGGEKAVGEARGPVYGRVGEGADVDGELTFRARLERQVVEGPAPALVARASVFEGVPDHLYPLLEERGPAFPLEAQ